MKRLDFLESIIHSQYNSLLYVFDCFFFFFPFIQVFSLSYHNVKGLFCGERKPKVVLSCIGARKN